MTKSMTTVRECALTLERIDTHSHVEASFPGLEEEARALAGMMETTPGLIAARVTAEGCRVLYGIDPGVYLTPEAPAELFARAAALRAAGAAHAFSAALDTARITRQFAFTGQLGFQQHLAVNCPLRAFSERIDLLAYLDPYITAAHDRAFTPQGRQPDFNFYRSLCDFLGPLPDLDAFLAAIDAAIDGWRQYGVIGMKIGLAYTTGLDFTAPTPAEARTAFAHHEAMTLSDVRMVQNFAVHHALAACLRQHFPVVIHTGYRPGFDHCPLHRGRQTWWNHSLRNGRGKRHDFRHSSSSRRRSSRRQGGVGMIPESCPWPTLHRCLIASRGTLRFLRLSRRIKSARIRKRALPLSAVCASPVY